MPWIISFIVSWILFILLVDKNKIKTSIWGGIATLSLASFVDWGGQQLKLYAFTDLIIPWFGCSAFYKFGPVFTMGVLFVQGISGKKWMQLLNILMYSLIFLSLEQVIIRTGVAQYIHWHFLASLLVDIWALASLTWFAMAFLKVKRIAGEP